MSQAAGEVDLEIHPPPAHHRYFDLTAGSLELGFSVILLGYAFKNPSSSVTAACDLYDSPDGTGVPIIPLTFAASESIGDNWMPNGILFKNAVYVNVTAGEVRGGLFFRHYRR